MKPWVHGVLGVWCLTAGMFAQDTEVVRLGADGAHQQAGRPREAPLVYAVAGKPLQLSWAAPNGAAASDVTVDQVTAARRVAIDQGQASVDGKAWVWQWTPPETRGVVTYEVKIAAFKKPLLILQVRDAEWFEQISGELGRMTWQGTGLNLDELDALATIGLQRIDEARDTPHGAVMLRQVPEDARAPRREVVWGKDPDRVVWSPGAAAGDAMVQAPRWWISPKALATDHGKIRFYDLFSIAPIVLRQP